MTSMITTTVETRKSNDQFYVDLVVIAKNHDS